MHCGTPLFGYACVFKCMGKTCLRFWRLSKLGTSTHVSAAGEPRTPEIFKASEGREPYTSLGP